MRVRDGASPTSDRERRAALEALQAELRQVRAAIAQERAATDTPPAVEALRDAVARAQAQRDEARQRYAELERERADLENQQRWLEREAQEEKILALGAARRNRYIDWAGVRIKWGYRGGSEGAELRTSPAAAVALALMPFVLLLLGVLAAVCGKR